MRKLIYTPEVMFADVKIDGKAHITLVKDIQFHPVSDEILHIDFYEVNVEKPIKLKIPIKITGSSLGVKAGGKLHQNLRKITIKGLINNIPDYFEIDISNLKIGESIRIKDLESEILEFIDNKSNVLVHVASARGAVTAEAGAEEKK